jgi:Domain of unknown function (DUF4382)
MRFLAIRSSKLIAGYSLAVLAGCGGGGSSPTSTLNLGLTDAPISGATKAWISFAGVEVKPVNGNPIDFTFSPAQGFDLLSLQNGVTATFLNGKTIPAGQYEWVRLMVDATAGSSYIIDSTGQHNLTIPSGAETGLKLNQGFTMPVGGVADFTVDFVLSKSIIAPPGQSPDYVLKPVLRLVDNAQVGTIAGSFQSSTLSAQSGCGTHAPVVYIYPGSGVTPDDVYNPINGATDAPTTPAEVEPLVTATAALNSSSVYAYSVPLLTTGTYTVAFTCDPDDPNVDESALTPSTIHFVIDPQAVTVTTNQTSTVNF